jgi:Putative peptidoglycan binding domain
MDMKTSHLLFSGLAVLMLTPTAARADHHDDRRRDDDRRSSFFWQPRPVVVIESRPVYRSYYSEPTYYPRYTVSHHSVSVDVQIALRRRGYYRGPIDGDIGPGSRAAIRAYQYDHGMRPTGYITDSLLRSLGI